MPGRGGAPSSVGIGRTGDEGPCSGIPMSVGRWMGGCPRGERLPLLMLRRITAVRIRADEELRDWMDLPQRHPLRLVRAWRRMIRIVIYIVFVVVRQAADHQYRQL